MHRAIVAAALCLSLVLVLAPGARAQALYKSGTGPCHVRVQDTDWRDAARGRDVPVRLYIPESPAESERERSTGAAPPPAPPFPVIVFSHGMGANRASYRYICEHLASHGYLVIVPTHEGSDTRAIAEELRRHRRDRARGEHELPVVVENTGDPENLKNRPLDIAFVLDHVGTDKNVAALADLSRVGVAGHSFGANTALEVAGMTIDLPGHPNSSFRDPRIKAVVPMSPQGAGAMGVRRQSWDSVAVPVLFLTGTKDYGQGGRAASWRREAFDAIRGVDEYLVVLNDATHMTFGRGSQLGRGEQAHHVELIKATTTAFFDAYVKADAAAKSWLRDFAGAKHDDCTAEFHARESGSR